MYERAVCCPYVGLFGTKTVFLVETESYVTLCLHLIGFYPHLGCISRRALVIKIQKYTFFVKYLSCTNISLAKMHIQCICQEGPNDCNTKREESTEAYGLRATPLNPISILPTKKCLCALVQKLLQIFPIGWWSSIGIGLQSMGVPSLVYVQMVFFPVRTGQPIRRNIVYIRHDTSVRERYKK